MTVPTDIYISREISIEHPSVGLASLAQLCMFFNVGGDYAGGGGGGGGGGTLLRG